MPTQHDSIDSRARQIRERILAYIADTPYSLNQDEELVGKLFLSLARREIETGYPVCPCRRMPAEEAARAVLACPCEEHPDQIAENGRCFCNLITGPKLGENQNERQDRNNE